ncbi:helix-turn-helix domain-containing protein [uncultured Thiodictyon sp.]|uniref:AraC family transcriptional regulator n=1 Tax=uncultured Thiodictyon sp. TaxID=1846217 RepID=UPI0025FA4A6A|nr:helix-turn-helix domain-containing protein [uncultured Thiodictyon sp.]
MGGPVARAATAFVTVQDIDDPCVWESASPPWEILASPLTGGPFRNRKQALVTPNWLLYRESFLGALRVQGMTPAGMLGFAVPIRLGGLSHYWGAAFPEQGLPASLPGALDARMDAGQEHVVALLRLDWLRAQVDPLTALAIEQCAGVRVLPAAPRGWRVLGTWLRRLLNRLHADPRVLGYPHAVATLESDLLGGLLRTLCLAAPRPSLVAATRRQRGFDLAIDYVRAADLGGLSVAALCAEVEVSQRTLEYAFQERLGTSPMEFIRRLRLHAARRALLAAPRGGVTVAQIAMTFGFYQLGRFSADYRSLFGELPSATLTRLGVYTGANLLG